MKNDTYPVKAKGKNNKDGLLIFLIIAALFIFFASCTSTRKIKTSESIKTTIKTQTSHDSAGVSKVDSSGTRTTDEATATTVDSSVSKTTTDSQTNTIIVNLEADTAKHGHRANDYEGAPIIDEITVNGNKIQANRRIKNVIITNSKGTQTIEANQVRRTDTTGKKATETSQVTRTDSNHNTGSTSTDITIDEKSKGKNVERTGASVLIWLPILILLIVGGYFAWRFGLFTKRRLPGNQDKNNNTLTTIKYEPPTPPTQKTK